MIVRISSALSRSEGMRVRALSVPHSGMEPLSIICDGPGAGITQYLPCGSGVGGHMIGVGVGDRGWCTSLSL